MGDLSHSVEPKDTFLDPTPLCTDPLQYPISFSISIWFSRCPIVHKHAKYYSSSQCKIIRRNNLQKIAHSTKTTVPKHLDSLMNTISIFILVRDGIIASGLPHSGIVL